MKIALVFNRESRRVINLFGLPNQEKIGQKAIHRIALALKRGGHHVRLFEGDKDLIDNLEDFMPKVLKGERPGLVFNLSYGIQGQARYTHIPSILEMVGIPYIGSGPLAHSLSLDKVVAKMIFKQHNLPTPEFFILETAGNLPADLKFPLIVKPKNEAVSFGIKVVKDEAELKSAAQNILEAFRQPVLVEQYIEGREINIGLIGNSPPDTFPACEIMFGSSGPRIYTFEDKTGHSGRVISVQCPADISQETAGQARQLALEAFKSLGCYDCARVDMRLNEKGELFILEVNSLPSLGEHGSYTFGAEAYGLDFTALVNRLVDIAYARYFGTPNPPPLARDRSRNAEGPIFEYVTRKRDELDKLVRKWVNIRSRTEDQLGISSVIKEAGDTLAEAGLLPADYNDDHHVWSWQSRKGLEGGVVLVAHVDVPLIDQPFQQAFYKEAEWIYGEGVATTKGPLAIMEFALNALKHARALSRIKMGVVLYNDEGLSCRYSAGMLRQIFARAGCVLVLRPTTTGASILTDHRGQRIYRFTSEGNPFRIEKSLAQNDLLLCALDSLQSFSRMSLSAKRLSIAPVRISSAALPMHSPHRIEADVIMTYANASLANEKEQEMLASLPDKRRFKCELKRITERPPLPRRSINLKLAGEIIQMAEKRDITLSHQSSAWPAVAGLVPASVPVVSGLGPYGRNLCMPNESIERLSLVQRALILATFLASKAEGDIASRKPA